MSFSYFCRIISILPKGSHSLLLTNIHSTQGKAQLISNINACQAVADAVRTTLGPRGMDKLVADGRRVTISNDGATIMRLLEIEHPAAKTLVDISMSQVRSLLPISIIEFEITRLLLHLTLIVILSDADAFLFYDRPFVGRRSWGWHHIGSATRRRNPKANETIYRGGRASTNHHSQHPFGQRTCRTKSS